MELLLLGTTLGLLLAGMAVTAASGSLRPVRIRTTDRRRPRR